MHLKVLQDIIACVRLPNIDTDVAKLITAELTSSAGGVFSVSRAANEITILCSERTLTQAKSPLFAAAKIERGFRCLEVEGPLDFSLVGIVANLSALLAARRIPVLVLSTFSTDLLLVRETHLAASMAALREGGHTVRDATSEVAAAAPAPASWACEACTFENRGLSSASSRCAMCGTVRILGSGLSSVAAPAVAVAPAQNSSEPGSNSSGGASDAGAGSNAYSQMVGVQVASSPVPLSLPVRCGLLP